MNFFTTAIAMLGLAVRALDIPLYERPCGRWDKAHVVVTYKMPDVASHRFRRDARDQNDAFISFT
jgi:hypothetical protein